MTIWKKKLLADPEPEYTDIYAPADDDVLRALQESSPHPDDVDPAVAEWTKRHPEGLDLGDNSKEIDVARKARDAVKGKKPAAKGPKYDLSGVDRPAMPKSPRGFEDLSLSAPGEGVETMDAQRKVAGDVVKAPGDPELLDAEQYANGRRERSGIAQAARMIGRAGLEKNPQSAQLDAQEMGNADRSLQFLKANRAERRQRGEDARAEEDQSFQRAGNDRATESQGFTREKAGREHEFNDPKSGVSSRRRAELLGLYGKEISKIPYEDFNQLSAADVDVLMKELSQQRSNATANRGAAAMERAFAGQVRDVGRDTAKAPYGEVEALAQRFEELAPGVTSGQFKGELPMGVGSKALLALPGGVGEGFVDDKSLSLHKSKLELIDLIERMRTGAVINDQEAKHYNALIGGNVLQDSRSLSMGLQTVFGSLRQKMKNAQAGYTYLRNDKGQNPLDVFSGSGGTDYRKSTGRVPMVGPNGETGTLDASEVEEAMANGWKRR